MELSITTDYARDNGNPEPYLKKIADTGFTHIHWCHHWSTDFIYSKWEIEEIGKWLRQYSLKLLDLHGSDGHEKNWASEREYERRAGVDLVENRIDMTHRLGGKVVIMHIPSEPGNDALRKSLDELKPFARERGIRLALENGNFAAISPVLAQYEPDYLGLCYDSGHGNLVPGALDELRALTHRLISIHLHDNDATDDQHNLLFSGTVNWPILSQILADSSYSKCISMEVCMKHSTFSDEEFFLKKAFETGVEFSVMVEEGRKRVRKGLH